MHSRNVRWIAPIEPHLEVRTWGPTRREDFAIWEIVAKVRGGEPIEEVRVEPASGPVRIITPFRRGLPPGSTALFHVELDEWRTATGVVRVIQSGRTEPYEVVLQEPK
jgi:hypothetical protein